MQIRSATLADAGAIAEVHVASWQTTYRGLVPDALLDNLSVEARTQQWRAALQRSDQCLFIAVDQHNRIIGFANGGPRSHGPAEYAGEVYAIYLLESAQGRGIGRALFAHVAGWLAAHGMRSLLVWVLAGNPATQFYSALGGVAVAQMPIEIGGTRFEQLAYAWPDIRVLEQSQQ